jgi:hypothetical protein
VKKKKIYRQNIFLQVLSFIAAKNNTLRRFVNTLSDRLVINDPADDFNQEPIGRFFLKQHQNLLSSRPGGWVERSHSLLSQWR